MQSNRSSQRAATLPAIASVHGSHFQSTPPTGAVGTKDTAEDVGLIVVRQKSAVLRRADLKPRPSWADRALFRR